VRVVSFQETMRTAFCAGGLLIAAALIAPQGGTAPVSAGRQLDTGGRGARAETPHLVLTIPRAGLAASPGARISLRLDIAPKPNMHVYAPEQKELIPISLSLDSDRAYTIHPPKFPKPERYLFEPLNETQLVYSKPFQIVQEVTIADTPAMRERAGAGAALTISGRLRYQACDDTVCYMPQILPVSWTVRLQPL
jgi:hypothetical protein